MAQLIETDSRHRISLGALAAHDHYLADVEDDGTIVLIPAVVMGAAEAALLSRSDLLDRIDSNRAADFPGPRKRPTRRRS